VGLVVLSIRFGLPHLDLVPVAVSLGVSISLGHNLAGLVPGGTALADAVLRGVAVGPTLARLIAVVDQDREFSPLGAVAAGIDLEGIYVVRLADSREAVEAAVLLAQPLRVMLMKCCWPSGTLRRTMSFRV
jgi:hypothetical protein